MTPMEMTDQAQRDGAALERARILGVAATSADADELAQALKAYHDGSEHGELRRLLVRLWGPSPARPMTPGELGHAADLEEIRRRSDLRGLAARESAPAHTGLAATWCPICGDCRCPYIDDWEDNGRTLDHPNCPLHGTKTTHPCPDPACDCHGQVSP